MRSLASLIDVNTLKILHFVYCSLCVFVERGSILISKKMYDVRIMEKCTKHHWQWFWERCTCSSIILHVIREVKNDRRCKSRESEVSPCLSYVSFFDWDSRNIKKLSLEKVALWIAFYWYKRSDGSYMISYCLIKLLLSYMSELIVCGDNIYKTV